MEEHTKLRKLAYSDLEALKVVLVQTIFEGLANAEDDQAKARWAKMAVDVISSSKVEWISDFISQVEAHSSVIDTEDVQYSLANFDLSKYLVKSKAKPSLKDRAKRSTVIEGLPVPYVAEEGSE